MKKIKFLSPTSITLWRRDPREYYLRYLSPTPPPKIPQTQPMAVGAAFDAYVKAYLYKRYFGGADPRFDFDTLFNSQVEPHNRIWGLTHGGHAFSQYRQSGALPGLMFELTDDISMELRMERNIVHSACVSGIPLVGVPDIFFIKDSSYFCYDWKVNGYCSASTTSPKPGYQFLYDNGTKKGPHKRADSSACLSTIDFDWATQLCIYGWLAGYPVGTPFTAGIDQLVWKGGGFPFLRVACFRNEISADFQESLYSEILQIWEIISSGYIFRDLSKTESLAMCHQLDLVSETESDWFHSVTREHSPW